MEPSTHLPSCYLFARFFKKKQFHSPTVFTTLRRLFSVGFCWIFLSFWIIIGPSFDPWKLVWFWFDRNAFFFFDEWQLHDGLIFQCEAARENESIVGADDESRIWVKCLFFSTSQSIFFSYGRLFHFVFCFSLVGLEATAGAICKWRHCKWRRPKIKTKRKKEKGFPTLILLRFSRIRFHFSFFLNFWIDFGRFFHFFLLVFRARPAPFASGAIANGGGQK